MRVIKETFVKDIRISVFEWNQKYLIKFEWGALEQTYKIDIWDAPDLEPLLLKIVEKNVISEVETRFSEMNKTRKNFFL